MKAIVRDRFGPPDVLELRDVEKPLPTEARGVLVKVRASSVNPADYYDVNAPFMIRVISRSGVRRPKDPKLGSDVAGIVESVGPNVTQFKVGDEVFGTSIGSYAEYTIAREDRLALKPPNCSFEQASAVGTAGITALQALRDQGNIQPGQKVLVGGAGGGVGTFAVQIAKSFGAEVTAVTNTENLEMVRSLGADHVIDYTKVDYTESGERYDLVCEIAASHSVSHYKKSLNPGGTFVLVGFKDGVIRRLISFFITSKLTPKGGKKFCFFIAKTNQKDMNILKDLIQDGKLRPVIDKSYPLQETAEAMRYLKTGKARGKIVITIG